MVRERRRICPGSKKEESTAQNDVRPRLPNQSDSDGEGCLDAPENVFASSKKLEIFGLNVYEGERTDVPTSEEGIDDDGYFITQRQQFHI